MKRKKRRKITIITAENFAKLGADNIARLLRRNKDLRIEGDTPGDNRKIIKFTK